MESSINQPHPADPAEAFFGPEPTEDQDPGDFTPNGDESPPWEPDTAAEPDGPTAEGQPAPASAPPAEQVQQAEQAQKAESQPRQSGPLTRQYIVFHELPLTKRVLEHLLAELESGDRGGEPRRAFFELHRAEARNANTAVGDAYTKHRERLGDEADVAAVTAKAFQKRHIRPRERVQTDIAITSS